MQLSSTSLHDNQVMPERYTRDGGNVSPPLTWSGAPSNTASFRLTCVDTDAKGFVHWHIDDIGPKTSKVNEGQVPPNATIEKNDFGNQKYDGPQPPANSGVHHYVFSVQALDEMGHVLDHAELTATYEADNRKAASSPYVPQGKTAVQLSASQIKFWNEVEKHLASAVPHGEVLRKMRSVYAPRIQEAMSFGATPEAFAMSILKKHRIEPRKVVEAAGEDIAHAPTQLSIPPTSGRQSLTPADSPAASSRQQRRDKIQREKFENAFGPAQRLAEDRFNKFRNVRNVVAELLRRADSLESPIKQAMFVVRDAAKSLKNPELEQKALTKFSRLFGAISNPISQLRGKLEPLAKLGEEIEHRVTTDEDKEKQELQKQWASAPDQDTSLIERKFSYVGAPSLPEVKRLFEVAQPVLDALEHDFASIEATSFKPAVSAEIEKQTKFLTEIEEVIKKTPNPKLQQAARFGSLYLAMLKKIVDPEFEDRISNNIQKAVKHDIPQLKESLKSLAFAYGAKSKERKTAKAVYIQKRLRRVSKRLATLHYLKNVLESPP